MNGYILYDMYTITYSLEAKAGLAKLKRSEPASFKNHVDILSAYGHYDDK